TLVFERRRADGVLVRRDAEEDERGDALVEGGADLFHQRVDAELVVARHRGDLLADALARADKERQDEVARRQRRLADPLPDEGVMAEAARARDRKFAHGQSSLLLRARVSRRSSSFASRALTLLLLVPQSIHCSGTEHSLRTNSSPSPSTQAITVLPQVTNGT